MTSNSKLTLALVVAVVLAGGAFYFLRDPPDAVAPAAAEAAQEGVAAPRADEQPPAPPGTTAAEVRSVATTSEPFEFMRGLANSAFEGDGRAQYLIGRELDRCEMTLTMIRKMPGDPEAVIWGMPDSWPQTLKERSIAEYRRCARLLKEDPFAGLPPRKGGYTFQYWKQRATESAYPLAVTERTLEQVGRQPADAAVDLKVRDESLRALTKATVSGDPDVALTIGFRQSWFDDPVQKTTANAWMLAACRLGADCGTDSRVYPFFMCYDPAFPDCDKNGDVERSVSYALTPEQYGDAYAQSQIIEEALRSRDPDAIRALLEKLVR